MSEFVTPRVHKRSSNEYAIRILARIIEVLPDGHSQRSLPPASLFQGTEHGGRSKIIGNIQRCLFGHKSSSFARATKRLEDPLCCQFTGRIPNRKPPCPGRQVGGAKMPSRNAYIKYTLSRKTVNETQADPFGIYQNAKNHHSPRSTDGAALAG